MRKRTAEGSKRPGLSVLVISRNSANLGLLFESMRRSRYDFALETIVAWNGKDKPGPPPADFPELNVTYHRIEPYNFACNNNRLAELARGAMLLFINDDIILDTGCLESARPALERPGVGIVGARLRYPDGSNQHAGIFFREDGTPYHRYKHVLPHDDPILAESMAVPAVTGAFMMLRRKDFIRIRFDESFRVCGEDVAFCIRFARETGKAVYYEAAATAVHNEGKTRRITRERLTPPDDLARIRAAYSGAADEAVAT
jgi:hypothetical protein